MAEPVPKVLLVSGRFEVRGTSAYTLRLAENLPDHGFEPLVVTTEARLVPDEHRRAGRIREYPRLDVPLWGRIVLRSLLADLSASPPALLHAQSWRVLRLAASLAGGLDRPLLLTVHDHVPVRQAESWARLPLRRIITVSHAVRSDLLGRVHLPDDAVEVVSSGVELPEDVETLPVLDPGHVPVVGTAGPLETVKGLPFFLGAAQRVLATGRDVEFVVAGAGPEEANLRRVARQLGIAGHVTFVPNLRQFTASLAAMDVFCLPSLRQGLGTVMLEAMSLGKPVIATSVGGVASIVRDGETGLLVPSCDSTRLAERILELLNDPLCARTLGEAGRRLAREEYSVARMTERTAAVYRSVLEELRASTALAIPRTVSPTSVRT